MIPETVIDKKMDSLIIDLDTTEGLFLGGHIVVGESLSLYRVVSINSEQSTIEVIPEKMIN